ncbi:myeloid-associated differentiation marker-like protein 2 [Osmerus mordax]|uniref:myeloid-associated differentiation marker-like protein 2 n=1 Tax=Osmerus mordax TaxID=8014 RepID=UPI00351082EB
MCGPFKSLRNCLKLVEIIFSALAFIIVLFRGRMVNPYGVWCEFVWVFCVVVPVVILVMELMLWNVLLAAFLPPWDDLTCGLTMLCTLMITSATIIFAVIFACPYCIVSILCVIFSLIATLAFLVDAVMAKMKCPGGYLSNCRGVLRFTEAFVACILLTAAANYFLQVERRFHYPAMVFCVVVYVVCLLVTVVIIVLHLIKLLRCLLTFGMEILELVFNVVAVLLYVIAVILWPIYGFRYYHTYHPLHCRDCTYIDMIVVLIGSIVNLVLYIVDLVLSILAKLKA